MKKSDFIKAKENAEKVNARNTNLHTQAHKNDGIDRGTAGDVFEIAIKTAMNNFRGSPISAKGRKDTYKGGKSYEIKCACGELEKYDQNGKVLSSIFSADYIIYSPDADASTARVFTANEFRSILEECGLLRYKRSSAAVKAGYANPDRLAIQSFTNSNKKHALFLATLNAHGIGFSDYCIANGWKN